MHNWFGWNLDPTSHWVILVVVLILLGIQTIVNIAGARVMARVARFGVYVEIVGTLGVALILAINGFHHGLGFLFSTQNVAARVEQPARAELPRRLARPARR